MELSLVKFPLSFLRHSKVTEEAVDRRLRGATALVSNKTKTLQDQGSSCLSYSAERTPLSGGLLENERFSWVYGLFLHRLSFLGGAVWELASRARSRVQLFLDASLQRARFLECVSGGKYPLENYSTRNWPIDSCLVGGSPLPHHDGPG